MLHNCHYSPEWQNITSYQGQLIIACIYECYKHECNALPCGNRFIEYIKRNMYFVFVADNLVFAIIIMHLCSFTFVARTDNKTFLTMIKL